MANILLFTLLLLVLVIGSASSHSFRAHRLHTFAPGVVRCRQCDLENVPVEGVTVTVRCGEASKRVLTNKHGEFNIYMGSASVKECTMELDTNSLPSTCNKEVRIKQQPLENGQHVFWTFTFEPGNCVRLAHSNYDHHHHHGNHHNHHDHHDHHNHHQHHVHGHRHHTHERHHVKNHHGHHGHHHGHHHRFKVQLPAIYHLPVHQDQYHYKHQRPYNEPSPPAQATQTKLLVPEPQAPSPAQNPAPSSEQSPAPSSAQSPATSSAQSLASSEQSPAPSY